MTCNSATRVVLFSSTCMPIEETRVCLTFCAARKEFSRSEEKLSAQQETKFRAARKEIPRSKEKDFVQQEFFFHATWIFLPTNYGIILPTSYGIFPSTSYETYWNEQKVFTLHSQHLIY